MADRLIYVNLFCSHKGDLQLLVPRCICACCFFAGWFFASSFFPCSWFLMGAIAVLATVHLVRHLSILISAAALCLHPLLVRPMHPLALLPGHGMRVGLHLLAVHPRMRLRLHPGMRWSSVYVRLSVRSVASACRGPSHRGGHLPVQAAHAGIAEPTCGACGRRPRCRRCARIPCQGLRPHASCMEHHRQYDCRNLHFLLRYRTCCDRFDTSHLRETQVRRPTRRQHRPTSRRTLSRAVQDSAPARRAPHCSLQ